MLTSSPVAYDVSPGREMSHFAVDFSPPVAPARAACFSPAGGPGWPASAEHFCLILRNLPGRLTVEVITGGAGDSGTQQIDTPGSDTGYGTLPFIPGEPGFRVFSQPGRNIAGDTDFERQKTAAFSAKMRENCLDLFHTLVGELPCPVLSEGLAWGLPFFFCPAAGAGGATTSGTDEVTDAVLSTTGGGEITRRFFTTITGVFFS